MYGVVVSFENKRVSSKLQSIFGVTSLESLSPPEGLRLEFLVVACLIRRLLGHYCCNQTGDPMVCSLAMDCCHSGGGCVEVPISAGACIGCTVHRLNTVVTE